MRSMASSKKCIDGAKDEYQIKIFLNHLEEIRIIAEAKLGELISKKIHASTKKKAAKRPIKKPIKKPAKRK